ncbi:MAG: hypothetical protein R3E01_33540 [Pirellulaceae bacterium]
MGENQVARDLPVLDDDVQVFARIFNTVWVVVAEKLEDGTVIVSHARRQPPCGQGLFRKGHVRSWGNVRDFRERAGSGSSSIPFVRVKETTEKAGVIERSASLNRVQSLVGFGKRPFEFALIPPAYSVEKYCPAVFCVELEYLGLTVQEANGYEILAFTLGMRCFWQFNFGDHN